MNKVKVEVECTPCGGTGLYRGFAEAPGEPVICMNCSGTGCCTLSYIPFTGRKHKQGVTMVRMSRGSFIGTGVGGVSGTEMSYDEFKRKIPSK